MLHNDYFDVVGEDGNKYPYTKKQYSINLSPLKTFDAIWVPTKGGEYAVFDRALGLTAGGQLGGGMFRKLRLQPLASFSLWTTPTMPSRTRRWTSSWPRACSSTTARRGSEVGGARVQPGSRHRESCY